MQPPEAVPLPVTLGPVILKSTIFLRFPLVRHSPQFMEQISPVASKVPWMVAVGNHERDFPYKSSSTARKDLSYYTGTDSGGDCGVPTAFRCSLTKVRVVDKQQGPPYRNCRSSFLFSTCFGKKMRVLSSLCCQVVHGCRNSMNYEAKPYLYVHTWLVCACGSGRNDAAWKMTESSKLHTSSLLRPAATFCHSITAACQSCWRSRADQL